MLLESRRKVAIREVASPVQGTGEVLVAPTHVSICGTDVHVFLGEFESRIPYPRILGHEFAGQVVRSTRVFSAGDRVVFDAVLPCGKCVMCQRGHLNGCLNGRTFGLDTDGAMAELVSLPEERVYRVPDRVSSRDAAILELYAVAAHAVRRAAIEPGDTVVVVGAGRLGLSLMDVIKETATSELIAVDISSVRLAAAAAVGAQRTVDARTEDPLEVVMQATNGLGADRIFEAVGDPVILPERKEPIFQAIEMMRPGGTIVLMGQGERLQQAPWRTLVIKEGHIVTSRTSLGEMPRAVRMMADGVLRPRSIITHEFPVQAAPEVFTKLASHDETIIKTVLDMNDWG